MAEILFEFKRSGNVVKYMINNSDSKKRNTGLKYKLINILK